MAGLDDLYSWLDDIVPNELQQIAPYIAPLIAPQMGITGALLTSQLGALDSGKFDPYAAASALIGANTQKAKTIRQRGRINPKKGTWGQRMSHRAVGDKGEGKTAWGQGWAKPLLPDVVRRGIDPRYSMMNWTSGNPNLEYGQRDWNLDSYVEAPGLTNAEIVEATRANDPLKTTQLYKKSRDYLAGDYMKGSYTGETLMDADVANVGEQHNITWDKAKLAKARGKGGTGRWQQKTYQGRTYAKNPANNFWYDVGEGVQPGLTSEGRIFLSEKADMGTIDPELWEHYKDLEIAKPGSGDAWLEEYGKVGGEATWIYDLNQGVTDMASEVYGFWSYDPVTGKRLEGSFDAGKALQTITVAGTLAELENIKDELEKKEIEDKEEEAKVYREWFRSYERTTGVPYDKSHHAEPHMLEMYDRYMPATSHHAAGGRVGLNVGGITNITPEMPQGMQLEGREGAFVPMGIEEKADDVPAMLSKNEFVLTADAMKGLDKLMGGQGDPRSAAQHMYQMMDQLEAIA